MTDTDTTDETEDESSGVNISRFRELAVRGHEYREKFELDYYLKEDEEPLCLYLRPLKDPEFLPIAAVLEDKMDIDEDEAQEMLEDEKDDTGSIDASAFDDEFVEIMQEAAIMGIDREQGDAAGESEEGVREIVNLLQGGKTLEIAERILDISSNAEKAKSFRGSRGSQ
jgi:hypothetical protein